MFERGERQRRADRARMASLGGYVGRNVGDVPYLLDHVLHDHFYTPYSDGIRVFSVGLYTISNSGSGAFSTAAPTSVVMATGATASSSSLLVSYLSNMTGWTRDASMRTRFKISAIDSTTTILGGFARGASALTTPDSMFFGAMGNVSTAHFVCGTRSSGVATIAVLDGGGGKATIPVDTAFHDVSIVCDSTAGEVRFYVDRQAAATITTDIPTVGMGVMFGAENGATGGASRTITVDVLDLAEAGG